MAEREIKGSRYLLFGFLENLIHEVCCIRIKEQVGEKRSTGGTHENADRDKTPPPNITIMLSIKKTLAF
jgi:hypothetical protein